MISGKHFTGKNSMDGILNGLNPEKGEQLIECADKHAEMEEI